MDIKKFFKKKEKEVDTDTANEKGNQVDVMYIKISYIAQKLPIDIYYKIDANNEEEMAEFISDISMENIETNKIYRASPFDMPLTISKSNRKKGESEQDYLKKKSGGQPLFIKGVFNEDIYLTKKNSRSLTEEEVGDNDVRVSPLVILADKYIKDKFGSPKIKESKDNLKPSVEQKVRKQQLIAILFRSSENPSAVLWLKNKMGNYVEKSFTFMSINDIDSEEMFRDQAVNSISRQLSISNESDTVSIDEDEIDMVAIPEVELLKYASPSFKKDAYPVESEIFGLPKNYVAITTSVLGAGIAFAGVSFDTYSNIQLEKVKTEESRVAAQMPDVQGIREDVLQDHVMYYLSDKSIDFKEGFRVAEDIWISGTKAQITQNDSITRVDLAMDQDQDDPQILYVIAKEMEEQKAPEGFTKEAVTSNGGFSTYRVSYVK